MEDFGLALVSLKVAFFDFIPFSR